MNKIFTSILALGLGAFAANATITVTTVKGNVQVENGGTVTVTRADYEDKSPVPAFSIWEGGASVIVKSDIQLTTKVTCDNSNFQFCPMPTCYGATDNGDGTYSFPDHTLAPNIDNTLEIHCNYSMVSELPEVISTMNVTLEGASEKFSFKVVVNTTEGAGVDGVGANTDKVTFANNTLSYNVASNSAIEIYSITGLKVLHEVISGEGTLSLSKLVPGVYIYRIGKQTKKICIR